MKLTFTIKSLFLTTLLVGMSPIVVTAQDAKPSKVLNIHAKHCLKTEVGYSMMGPTSTHIFYSFTDKKVVLRVTISNKIKDFPITAKIHNFADDTTEEGLKGWVNNQHSDAIFPDVPEPLNTHLIPADSCKIISKKLIDTTEVRNVKYENYSVGFQLINVPVLEGIKITDLNDVATVRVKKVTAKKAYPAHWGNPPMIQTRDYRPLPGGYGMGSGTLAKWIAEKMKADKKNAVPTFDAWVKAGKKIPEDMVFPGGSPWFDESTGKNRSAEAVYKMLFGKDGKDAK